LGKFLRLVINRLGVVLLISVVFLSATQQVLSSTKQTIPLAYPEALPAIYPKLNFSTYFGGSEGSETGYGIAVTEDGSCYLTGRTSSINFPTQFAFDSTISGSSDAFVAKLSGSGSLLWSTFFGGNDSEISHDISVASDGSCYVTGSTESSDFPTLNASDNTYGGYGDIFLAKFSSIGQLLWSSYFGGNRSDKGRSIAVTSDGSCYVTGSTESSDFPTQNAFDSTHNGGLDAFVSKFSTNGSLLWSTFFGGSDFDYGNDISVAGDGSCYVTGFTESSDFPTLDAYNPTLNSGYMDAFVAKFSSSGSLLWSTYLGGFYSDYGYGVTVASDDSCYVTGQTKSSDFPTQNAYASTFNGGNSDAFVSKFSTNGILLWSTYLGGSDKDIGRDIAVTSDGSCYVTGWTRSSDFPIRNAFDRTCNRDHDAFISKFNVSGFLLWSTYLGGRDGIEQGYSLAVTEDGSCFVTGSTSSNDFPTENAYRYTLGGSSDAFATKIVDSPIPPTRPLTVTGFLVFIAVMLSAVLPVIALIVYKKQK